MLVVALLLGATACNKEEETKNNKLSRDEVYSEVTESLKLDLNPTGKSFLTDGVEVVKLSTISDGDTASFTLSSGGTIRVRFYGVDTPESTGEVNKWGVDASKFSKARLNEATEYLLESSTGGAAEKDSYTRYLGYVWYRNSSTDEWKNLNLQLVENGYTQNKLLKTEDTKYYNYFHKAEEFAKNGQLRIWGNDEDPLFSTEAQAVNLKELSENPDAFWNEETQAGNKVRIEATITGLSVAESGTHLFEATQVIDGKTYKFNIYTGYSGAAVTSYLKIGNKYSMTGYVQNYYGKWQISGLVYVLMETGKDYTFLLKNSAYLMFNDNIEYIPRYANNLKYEAKVTEATLDGTTLTMKVSAKNANNKNAETITVISTVEAGFNVDTVLNKSLAGGVYLDETSSSARYIALNISVGSDQITVS